MSMLSILAAGTLAASQVAVTDKGPALEPIPVEELDQKRERTLKAEKCVSTWRLINLGIQGADIASTVAGIRNGGEEKNPLAKALMGKHPKLHELVAYKVVGLSVFELLHGQLKPRSRCTVLKLHSALTLTAVGMNLRVAF